MTTMEHFYLALEDALTTNLGVRVVNLQGGLLRIIFREEIYCPITFVAQVHQLGDYGDRCGDAHHAGQRLQMRRENTDRVIRAADNNGAPVVRNKLVHILRPYMQESL